MKKLLICTMLAALTLFSSCLKNEEPQSLVDLRNAKATLIQAEAQYKLAEAAYKQAQTEFQNAQTANQLLLNQLQELKNQIAATEVEIAKLEVEIAKASSAAEIAQYEALKAQYELNLLDTKNDMEAMIEQHKIQMYNLLAQVAAAEQEYQDALEYLEAKKLVLSQDEQDLIDSYVDALVALKNGGNYYFNGSNYNVPTGILDLQQDLVDANNKLAKDQYMWDKESAVKLAKLDSIKYTAALESAKEVLEMFKAFTKDTDIEAWKKKVEDIETLVEKVNVEIINLDIEAEKFDEKIADVNLNLQAILAKAKLLGRQKDSIATESFGTDDPAYTEKGLKEAEKTRLNDEFNAYVQKKENEEYFTTYTIPGKSFQDWLYNFSINQSEMIFPVTVTEPYNYDKVTGEYYLPENTYTFNGLYGDMWNFERYVQGALKAGAYDENEIAAREIALQVEKDNFENGIKIAYEANLVKWTNAIADLETLAEQYMLERDVDLQDRAVEAITLYETYTTPTDAQTLILVNVVKNFRTVRDNLEDNPYKVTVDGVTKPIQDLISVDNIKAGKITLTQIHSAVNSYVKLKYTSFGVGDASVLRKWHESSNALWGRTDILVAINEATFGDSWSLVYNYSTSVDKPVLALNDDIKLIIDKLGYSINDHSRTSTQYFDYITVPALQGGDWWKYVSAQYSISYHEFVLNNQTAIKTLLASVNSNIALYEETEKEKNAKVLALNVALSDIDIEIHQLIEKAGKMDILITEQYKLYNIESQKIDQLNYEQNLAYQEKNNAEVRRGALNTLMASFLGYLEDAYTFETGSFAAFTTSKEVQKAFADQILVYEEDIIDCEADLYDANKTLSMLYEGLDNENLVYENNIAQDKIKIEKIESELKDLNDRFDYFTDLLTKTLAIFTASGSN